MQVRKLLTLLESLPEWAGFMFTTTNEGHERLFDGCDDSAPLLSRCIDIALARRDLAKPFAERARQVAQELGLDGQPIEKYVKLAQDCKNNLRMMYQRIEAGAMAG